MKIVIFGGTGLIGRALTKRLLTQNNTSPHELVIVSRSCRNLPPHEHAQKKSNHLLHVVALHDAPLLRKHLTTAHAVINLAGTNIAHARWSPKRRQEILSSRTQSTLGVNALLETIPSSPPQTIINASAIGIYDEASHHVFSEQSPTSTKSFLSQVCTAWEHAFSKQTSASPHSPQEIPRTTTEHKKNIRRISLRIAIVLSPLGGAFTKILPFYQKGLGSVLGSGHQGFSWIHIDDLVNIFLFIIDHPQLHGPINACAPYPVQARTLTSVLSRLIRQPTSPPLRALPLRLIMGEKSTLLCEGAFIIPQILQNEKFVFAYPSLEKALKNLISNHRPL